MSVESQLRQELSEVWQLVDSYKTYAERYMWLRDRLQVRYEQAISGGNKRATLTMRVGFCFLDSAKDPESGWTDIKYFDECRSKVDDAIDKAMQKQLTP